MSMRLERTWSATTRRRTSSGGCGPHRDRSWPVDLAGDLGGLVQDRVDLVDLVEVVDALQDRGHALQAHAGVDVLGAGSGPRISKSSFQPPVPRIVLHEHEVPDLEVAVLVDRRAALPAVLRTAVVVDLAARAARTGTPM
jgi:hypothetical protein